MIDVTSSLELRNLDTYTKGHVNFRKEDYYVLSYTRYNLYFDKVSDVLSFISSENAIYDVKNKFYEKIEKESTEGIAERLDNYWRDDKIRYYGSAFEKVKTVAFDTLQNNFLSDKNSNKYRIIVSESGNIIRVYEKSGKSIFSIIISPEEIEIHDLFAGRYLEFENDASELSEFICSYFEKCGSMLFNNLVKTLAK